MGVISANDYVPDPSLTPAEIEIIRAYIADPSRLLGPELVSPSARGQSGSCERPPSQADGRVRVLFVGSRVM